MFNVPAYVWWGIAALTLCAFVIYTAFLALCTVRSIKARGVEFPDGMRTVAIVWLAIGKPADIAFNYTWGYLIFGELWGTTFSSHVQRRVDRGDRDDVTRLWSNFLNAGASGHIKRVPPDWIQ